MRYVQFALFVQWRAVGDTETKPMICPEGEPLTEIYVSFVKLKSA